jgi:hypothetical protein
MVFALSVVNEREQRALIDGLVPLIAAMLSPGRAVDAFFDRVRERYLQELVEQRLRPTAMS